jgi:hypothetical protein
VAQQQQLSAVWSPFAQPSNSSPESTAHPIHQAIEATYVNWRRPNVALLVLACPKLRSSVRSGAHPFGLSSSYTRHCKSPAAGRQRLPYLTTCRPALSRGSAAHSERSQVLRLSYSPWHLDKTRYPSNTQLCNLQLTIKSEF